MKTTGKWAARRSALAAAINEQGNGRLSVQAGDKTMRWRRPENGLLDLARLNAGA